MLFRSFLSMGLNQIAKEFHSRLFERFYRVDKARSREQGGTGLGLAIVDRVVQRHQGRLEIKNREAGGLAVHITLPN